MLTAEARARASAWALASRARAWTLAKSGMAIAARMPMMATTIINSMSVKPRWLPSTLRFQNLFIASSLGLWWPCGRIKKLNCNLQGERLQAQCQSARCANLAGQDRNACISPALRLRDVQNLHLAASDSLGLTLGVIGVTRKVGPRRASLVPELT